MSNTFVYSLLSDVVVVVFSIQLLLLLFMLFLFCNHFIASFIIFIYYIFVVFSKNMYMSWICAHTKVKRK